MKNTILFVLVLLISVGQCAFGVEFSLMSSREMTAYISESTLTSTFPKYKDYGPIVSNFTVKGMTLISNPTDGKRQTADFILTNLNNIILHDITRTCNMGLAIRRELLPETSSNVAARGESPYKFTIGEGSVQVGRTLYDTPQKEITGMSDFYVYIKVMHKNPEKTEIITSSSRLSDEERNKEDYTLLPLYQVEGNAVSSDFRSMPYIPEYE